MRDLNQKGSGDESGWEWIAFWVDHANYWNSRLQATGDEHYQGNIDHCWRMVDMEIF